MINEQQKQAIAVLNRLHGQGPNAGFLLTDEEYFMLMEYVLQEKQIQFAPYEPQPITPLYYRTTPQTGDPLPMPPYEVTCKFGKVED
jgi:hypothetical protein